MRAFLDEGRFIKAVVNILNNDLGYAENRVKIDLLLGVPTPLSRM